MSQIELKELLSGSTDGKLIKVVATGTPGTLIHTADATVLHELYLWAINTDTVNRKLTIEFGGVASPDDLIELTMLPESGLIAVVEGLMLINSLVVRAFADAANVVNVGGYIKRISSIKG